MRKALLVCSLLVASNTSWAYQAGKWNFGGFADQALINTTDNNFYGATDDRLGSDIHELAVYGRGAISDSLDFSGQILSRDAGATDNDKPNVDFAFFTYTMFENAEWTDSFRLGRVKRPYAIYADSRSSPFSRPSIIMPQGSYYDRTRNVLFSYDGLEFHVERRNELSTYSIHAGLGIARPLKQEIDELLVLKNILLGSLQPRDTHHIQFNYDYDSGHFQIVTGFFKLHYNYDPLSPKLILDNGEFNLLNQEGEYYFSAKTLGVEYNTSQWSIVSEVGEATTLFNGFSPTYSGNPIISRGGYIQYNYHLNNNVQLYTRYDDTHLDETHTFTEGTIFRSVGFQHWATTFYDRVVGVSWLPTNALLLRSELHAVKGTGFINASDTASPKDLRKNWRMLAFEAAYRF
ncbi:MAG TPA: hypothetical protein VFM46_05710 [Pseudomonadales bacterium]|nr:hypothetical protein [Pseudomonadales bacterium]